jgi:CHASE3 domain sensor protein
MPVALITRANSLAFTSVAILLTAIGVVTWERFAAAETARRWVRHTEEVLLGIGDLGIAIRDAETGQRGYLLTGEESYLAPYQEALGRISLLQGDLQRLTADNQSQQAAHRTLGPLLQHKLEELGQRSRSIATRASRAPCSSCGLAWDSA